ncbi:hypothetical protein ACHAQJ_006834 [Trichoderma viride]
MLQPSELLLRYADCTDDDSYDSAVEDEFYNGEDPWDENPYKGRVFHKFAELPPELRIKIWELGLAGLSQPQFLQFNLDSTSRKDPNEMVSNGFGEPVPRRYRDWSVNACTSLARATELNRNVMAVNREARQVARRLLPHSLKISIRGGGHGLVYFDRDRDVVQLKGYKYGHIHTFSVEERIQDFIYHLGGFAEHVVQLAIRHDDFDDEELDASQYFTHALSQFPNLKRLFLVSMFDKYPSKEILWCGSDYIHVHTSILRDGRNEPLWTNRCWPNVDDYDDFTRNEVPAPITHLLPGEAVPFLRTNGIQAFPMLVFDDKLGLRSLTDLKVKWKRSYREGIPAAELSESESEDDDDDDDESEPNEYESDGIDDSEIEESVNGEDEDGTVSGDDIYADENEHDHDGIDLNGEIDLSGDGVGDIVPVFSDLESEPELETNGSNAVPGEGKNPRKRRIVTDSDDDEDASEGSRRKHARTGSFTAQMIVSDDEAISKPNGNGRSRRRAAIIVSDDDDEDDEDEKEDGGGGALDSKLDENDDSEVDELIKRETRKGRESSDEDDDEEEEEIMDVRRLSLASRLQLVREDHPSSEEEFSDEIGFAEGGEYGDNDDDDIYDDEDDDDEERYGGGLIDGIAEESE